jgi:EAL domain-containing protein (putative c-di-GMP-specific phosphodiesterase class I)
VPLGAWALRRACTDAQRWNTRPGCDRAVSVNVSARQLQHPALAEDVAAALAESASRRTCSRWRSPRAC